MTQQIHQPGRPVIPYAQAAPEYGRPQPRPYGPPASQYGSVQPFGYGQPPAPAPYKRADGTDRGCDHRGPRARRTRGRRRPPLRYQVAGHAEAQTKIADLTKQQIGVTPTDVSCPSGVDLKAGTTFHCTATLDGQAISYTVRETDDQGNVRVDSDNNLILVSKVEQSVAQQTLYEAGVQANATCDTGGSKVLVDSANKPIDCTVVNAEDDTDTLDVQATVDDRGNVRWTS